MEWEDIFILIGALFGTVVLCLIIVGVSVHMENRRQHRRRRRK